MWLKSIILLFLIHTIKLVKIQRGQTVKRLRLLRLLRNTDSMIRQIISILHRGAKLSGTH